MTWLSASAVLVLVVSATTASSAQSLADVARQEEARRKAIKSSGKVYTNANIRPEPPPSAPPAPITSTASTTAAATGTEPQVTAAAADGVVEPGATAAVVTATAAAPTAGQESQKGEAYWRARLQAIRDGLARAETFAEALQSRVNALSTDFVNRDDPAQRSVIGANRDKALAELERVRREIQDFTKAMTTLQDEARRAGVPPGWVR